MLDENEKCQNLPNNWQINSGFEKFLRLPFKKTLAEFLVKEYGFTEEIYKIMEMNSLDAEKNGEKWSLINQNQRNIKCKF
jgi:hypothetical protein